jgi:hypothetical protein
MSSRRLGNLAAIGGIVGPLLFAGALATLTVLEYDFMRSLGWDPLRAPTLDWPSGLSLGRYGILMTLTFVLCGALMGFFALGLRGELAANRLNRIGTRLLALAGLTVCGLAFATDPTRRVTPATWHGRLHDLSFVLLGLSLLPAMLTLGAGPLYLHICVGRIGPAGLLAQRRCLLRLPRGDPGLERGRGDPAVPNYSPDTSMIPLTLSGLCR